MSRAVIEPVPLARYDRDFDGFARSLGESFERFGFSIIEGHGLDQARVDAAMTAAKAFFALPQAAKLRYRIAGGAGQRGYTPFGVETAKQAKTADLKEFWHIGRDLPEGHRLWGTIAPNIWPDEIASFRPTLSALYRDLDDLGRKVLSGVARRLGLAPNAFEAAVRDGDSVLRLLHYPPLTSAPPAGAVRAGAHEDINAITLLLGADEAGLELLDRDGHWLAINPPAGSIVVNIGDMLQRLTNHRLPSTTHRVVNPRAERSGAARFSMPFFLHFAPDFEIRTLPGCISAERPDRYPQAITARAYLDERLRELKLTP